jgi:hypothetical protein
MEGAFIHKIVRKLVYKERNVCNQEEMRWGDRKAEVGSGGEGALGTEGGK